MYAAHCSPRYTSSCCCCGRISCGERRPRRGMGSPIQGGERGGSQAGFTVLRSRINGKRRAGEGTSAPDASGPSSVSIDEKIESVTAQRTIARATMAGNFRVRIPRVATAAPPPRHPDGVYSFFIRSESRQRRVSLALDHLRYPHLYQQPAPHASFTQLNYQKNINSFKKTVLKVVILLCKNYL